MYIYLISPFKKKCYIAYENILGLRCVCDARATSSRRWARTAPAFSGKAKKYYFKKIILLSKPHGLHVADKLYGDR
jgi:hypothetical protein